MDSKELAQIEADSIVNKVAVLSQTLKVLNERLYELQQKYDVTLSNV